MIGEDSLIYSPENLFHQTQNGELKLGYYSVRFYVDGNGSLAKEPTDCIEEFYMSPSGGTLRDRNMNIVIYSAKFDKYKGYGKI